MKYATFRYDTVEVENGLKEKANGLEVPTKGLFIWAGLARLTGLI